MTVLDAGRGRRAAVLAALRQAGAPVPVDVLAARLGMHANTARFHLERLVREGEADRTTELRTSRGRPRTLYRAAPSASDGQRNYRLLAEVLAGSLASNLADPGGAAAVAGRQWGRALVERDSRAPRPIAAAAATARLVEVLDGVGFAPELVTAGRHSTILLHQCPFLEAAQHNTEVVCAVHLGLMQGVLDGLRAPVVAERLEPFVQPGLCAAHLITGRDARRTAPGGRVAPQR